MSTTDTAYAADVRISFNQEGYWSLVGQDSVNSAIIQPGQASMNFGGFTLFRPADWEGVVIHEFGHAFGFEHEHQNPIGGRDDEFRWKDDPGYLPTTDTAGEYIQDSQNKRPGIYTVLGGPPNSWLQAKVDFNLRQLPDSHAYMIGPFDRNSIMKYYFPAWMFASGEQSRCYSKENLQLSAGDKTGFAKAYPAAPADITTLMFSRKQFLNDVLNVTSLGETQKLFFYQQKSKVQ